MKRKDESRTIIIIGDKNKVSFSGKPKISTIAIAIFAVVVLVVSLSYPDLLADVIPSIMGQLCK